MTTTVDPHLGARWRQLAFILRGEKRVQTEALAALQILAAYSRNALDVSGMDPAVLDNRAAPWRDALNTGVVPAVEDLFTASWDATARGAIDVTPYATRHIESVWNRMVGVADTEFDTIRTVLEEGRSVGESIPQLAKRVDAHLKDGQRWKGRAETVARTEVIGAANMGSHAASRASADYLGVDHKQVAKRWLATEDTRTRPTHRTADGQTVMGLDTPFVVGGAHLIVPGDPSGPAKEVIRCRCAPTYSYPGDDDYPADQAPAPQLIPAAPATTAAPAADTSLTPDFLHNALDPGRRRTSTAITKELATTAEGRDLSASIKAFTETRGGVANLRKNLAKTIDGTASKAVAARSRAFITAINNYPTTAVPKLFRGMAVKVEENTAAWWDTFEAQFQPGQRFDLSASSFSSSEKKAAEFSRMIGGTRSVTRDYTAVRFVLEGDTHALPVEALSKFKSEKEWITGGEFEVTGYTAATPAHPYYEVVIRQVQTMEVP